MTARRNPELRAWVAGLTAREKVAYLIGGLVTQGIHFDFALLDRVRAQLGDDRSARCRKCGAILPPRPSGQRGRPPVTCPPCRGLALVPETGGTAT